nr:multicopper oxidase domain-containing protein [Hoyosella subflava]
MTFRRTRRLLAALLTGLLLVGIGGVVALMAAWNGARHDTTGVIEFENALDIPPLADSRTDADGTRVFDLTMQRGTTDLGHGPATETWGVNGSYLGPTVRADRGGRVRLNVSNELSVASTLHWHGMHLPAAMDGGPHQMIEPGETWSPEWTIDQAAASLWYHPHLHGATAEHVYRGIAGMFLIDDAETPELPSSYGVDDVPLIVQDKRFRDGQLDLRPGMFTEAGIIGSDILVNGTPAPFFDVTTERVRLRLLNASNARTYNFTFTEGVTFDLIATDGGLLAAPVRLSHLMLSPGERAEIVVSVPAGSSTVLRSVTQPLGLDMWTNRFSGGDDSLDILELRAGPSLTPNTAVPDELVAQRDLGEPTVTRTFSISGSNEINDQTMDMGRIDEVVEVNTTEMWEVRNGTGAPHNFHVHDVQFQILDSRDPALAGPKDTVYIPPGETVRLLMRFEHYTDPEVPYMYHCHILAHEDRGLMGQFVVIDASAHQDRVPQRLPQAGHHH